MRILRLLLDVTLPSTCKCRECILLLKGLYFLQFATEKHASIFGVNIARIHKYGFDGTT